MNKFERVVLNVFFIELFIGGGGRLFEIGPISIRQLLFVLVIGMYAYRVLSTKNFKNPEVNTLIRKNITNYLVYFLIFCIAFSGLMGIINGNPFKFIVMDVLRVSFLGLFFPLSYYISEEKFSKEKILNLIKYGAIIVALLTIVIDVTGKFIITSDHDFHYFYQWINGIFNDDLFFRPSRGVFYKSQLYVLIGLVISYYQVLNKKYSVLNFALIILCSVSMFWSETRGLIIAFIAAIIFMLMLDAYTSTYDENGFKLKFIKLTNKEFLTKVVITVVVCSVLPFLYKGMTLARFPDSTIENVTKPYTSGSSSPSKNESDISTATRVILYNDSKRIILSSPKNFVLGSGYGTKIGDRETGIEMSFIDIWVEQGLIGLFAWLAVCWMVFWNFLQAFKQKKSIDLDSIIIMGSFMSLLILTNINPFINNPIGISFFIIALSFSLNQRFNSEGTKFN